jgi:AraC-like DNA-binding protein
MDLMADVLGNVQFKGTVICQSEFSAPWSVAWNGRANRAGFFMVLRGSCHMITVNQDKVRTVISLAPGDFVMSPRAQGYTLCDSVKSVPVTFDDVLMTAEARSIHRTVRHGGGGNQTKIIMGCFDLDTSTDNPVVRALPDFVHVRSEDLQSEPWLETSLRFLAAECAADKLGSSITVSGLMQLIFVQAVRVHVGREQCGSADFNWLFAVSDPHIGRALKAIHEHPAYPWTVAQLAARASMCRSSFAPKFKEFVKMTPLDYVTAWRIYRAQKLLRTEEQSLHDVAANSGYQSEAAFCKAFKRTTGLSPGQFRKNLRTLERSRAHI